MIRVATASLLLLLAGCAPRATAPASTPIPVEISYEIEPCFGACPVYSVTVGNMGQPGLFEGKRFTAVEGRRSFAVSPRAFQAFALALDEARMASAEDFAPGAARCKLFATDHSGVAVTFRHGSEAPWTFRFNYGCRDPQNAKLADSLRRAPTLLPIADLIGRR